MLMKLSPGVCNKVRRRRAAAGWKAPGNEKEQAKSSGELMNRQRGKNMAKSGGKAGMKGKEKGKVNMDRKERVKR